MMTEEDWRVFEHQKQWSWRQRTAEMARMREVLIREQGSICAICGGEMDYGNGFDQEPTVDHVISLAMGGADRLGNLVAAHRRCNTMKGSLPPTGCTLVFLLAVNNRLGVEPRRW